MILVGLLLHVAFGVLFMVDRRRKSEFGRSFPLLDGPVPDDIIARSFNSLHPKIPAAGLGYDIPVKHDGSTFNIVQGVHFPEGGNSAQEPVSMDDRHVDDLKPYDIGDPPRVSTPSAHAAGIWGTLRLNWVQEIWSCWHRIVGMVYSMFDIISVLSCFHPHWPLGLTVWGLATKARRRMGVVWIEHANYHPAGLVGSNIISVH